MSPCGKMSFQHSCYYQFALGEHVYNALWLEGNTVLKDLIFPKKQRLGMGRCFLPNYPNIFFSSVQNQIELPLYILEGEIYVAQTNDYIKIIETNDVEVLFMKKMPKWGKSIISLIAILLCASFVVTNAYAYTPSETTSIEVRNKIAKNWSFMARGYKEYNCLAWALGNTTTWVWPWSGNASVSQVNDYMSDLGYSNLFANMSCDIYAYGTTSSVAHFARGRGAGPLAVPIDAKWGACELFTHTSTNPYYTIAEGGLYGNLVRAYIKN